MILEEGKSYINRHGKVYGPMTKHHNFASTGWMIGIDREDNTFFQWYFEAATGRRIIDMHDLASANHLIDEFKETETKKVETTPIDKVTFAQLQRGVAKIWDSYRFFT